MQVAVRGFTYGEYASMALAEVKTPPFTMTIIVPKLG